MLSKYIHTNVPQQGIYVPPWLFGWLVFDNWYTKYKIDVPIIMQLSKKNHGASLRFFLNVIKLDSIQFEKNSWVSPMFWFKKYTQMVCNGLKSIEFT